MARLRESDRLGSERPEGRRRLAAGTGEPLVAGEAALELVIARLAARAEEFEAMLRALEEPEPGLETARFEGVGEPALARVIPLASAREEERAVEGAAGEGSNGRVGVAQPRDGRAGSRSGTRPGSAAALREREQALAGRERELARTEELLGARRERLEQQAARVAAEEEDLHERLRELEAREAAFEEREARAQADRELRLDRIEEQERELAKLAERLENWDRDLRTYAAEIQRLLSRNSFTPTFREGAEQP